MHKTVVQISGGNGAQKERTGISRVASTSANRRYVNSNGNSNNINNNNSNNRLAVTKERQYKDLRNSDLEKSRSLDSEYQVNARTDFDQSRSFDENYGEQVAPSKYLDSYTNSMKQAVVTTQSSPPPPPPPTSSSSSQSQSQPLQPQLPDSLPNNYANRYYDLDVAYDKSRKSLTRSPLIGYKHEPKNTHAKHSQSTRDNAYRSITKSFDHLQSAITTQQQQIQSASMQAMREHSPTKRAYSQNHMSALAKMSPGYDLNASDFNVSYDIRSGKGDMLNKEAKLLSEYYFGGKANADASYLNQRRREPTKPSPTPPSARYLRN